MIFFALVNHTLEECPSLNNTIQYSGFKMELGLIQVKSRIRMSVRNARGSDNRNRQRHKRNAMILLDLQRTSLIYEPSDRHACMSGKRPWPHRWYLQYLELRDDLKERRWAIPLEVTASTRPISRAMSSDIPTDKRQMEQRGRALRQLGHVVALKPQD